MHVPSGIVEIPWAYIILGDSSTGDACSWRGTSNQKKGRTLVDGHGNFGSIEDGRSHAMVMEACLRS
ncbi:MAG: hypothetical protein ACLUI0_11835 [Blautia massiliensis (ex Durand et al. 2017)]